MNYPCLIVEDEVLSRKNLCKKIRQYEELFSLMGEAKNGSHALELIESTKIVPALVITDIQMPVMDGLALAERLFTNYPQTKILVLSGYNDFSYAQKAIHYNVCDYLLKPVEDGVLYESLLSIKMQLDSVYHVGRPNPGIVTDATSPKNVVDRIRSYISMHYTEELSLDDLAEQFGFSPAYLRRIFKQYTEYTPSQYLTHLRIGEAKRMLLTNGELNVNAIGKLCGYKDPYYFSRIFKKCTGIYPTEYRCLQRTEQEN